MNQQIKEIYLIRHGQTDWNILGKSQGQEADIKLNEKGKEEAQKTGIYLKTYRINGNEFDAIYCSPLKRAKETAKIITKEINYSKDIIYDNKLKEKKMGILSGTTKKDEIYSKMDNMRYNLSSIDPIERELKKEIIEGKIKKEFNIGSESELELEDRASKFIKRIIDSKHKKIIISSHGGILLAIIRKMFNICLSPYGNLNNGGNCWISYITYDNNTLKFKMITAPNTEHLSI